MRMCTCCMLPLRDQWMRSRLVRLCSTNVLCHGRRAWNFTKKQSMPNALYVHRWNQRFRALKTLGLSVVSKSFQHVLTSECGCGWIKCFNPQDFRQHIKLSDMLLSHFTSQWRDRMTYWMARQRSRSVRDILTCIIDSYDKAKVCLPKFYNSRTPKAQVYESIRSGSTSSYAFYVFLSMVSCTFQPHGQHRWLQGTQLTLTCAICHGYGVYMFLGEEGMASGANWILELVTCADKANPC